MRKLTEQNVSRGATSRIGFRPFIELCGGFVSGAGYALSGDVLPGGSTSNGGFLSDLSLTLS